MKVITTILCSLLLLLSTSSYGTDDTILVEIQPGDILISRNAGGEDINTSPGWWNHTAIYIGHDRVVEAQEEQGVITSSFKEFYDRYPYVLIVRPRETSKEIQGAFIKAAESLVGREYNKGASILFLFFDFGSTENCVSTVRRAFSEAYGFDPGWRIPDGVAEDWYLLREIWSKGI